MMIVAAIFQLDVRNITAMLHIDFEGKQARHSWWRPQSRRRAVLNGIGFLVNWQLEAVL